MPGRERVIASSRDEDVAASVLVQVVPRVVDVARQKCSGFAESPLEGGPRAASA